MPRNDDGVFVEPDNEDRAGFALRALQEYAAVTRNNPDEQVVLFDSENVEELVKDLLCDLMHLADLAELEVDDLIESARYHHDCEVDEEALSE